MGNQTQWPTWVVCQPAFATLMFLLLTSCGSTPGSSTLQKGPTAILKLDLVPVYDFGIREVNTSTEVTFTVSNKGMLSATDMTGSFNLSLAFSFKGGSFPGTDGTCTSELNVGLSCTVNVVFSPPISGYFENPVTISYFNGIEKTLSSEPMLKGRGN